MKLTTYQPPSHSLNKAAKTGTATPVLPAKPSDTGKRHSRASTLVESVLRAPVSDGVIVSAPSLGKVMVSFIDATGTKALDCLLSELEDVDDLFARARVAGIINKNVRLLEVYCGGESILGQKRIAQDFDVLKQKMMEKKPKQVLVESGG